MNQLIDADGIVKPILSDDDWQGRRERALSGMQEVLGPVPYDKRCNLDIVIEAEKDFADITVQSLWYSSEPGCRTPAFLIRPCGTKNHKLQAILCLHGRNHKRGNRGAVNIDGDQATGLGCDLARRGHVVIAPCYPNMAHYPLDIPALGYSSASMKAVWDNIRALDILDTLTEVRHQDYAAIGPSMGGYNSLFTTVFDQRIRIVACGCGFDSYVDYMNGDLSVWGDPWHLPKILNYAPGAVPFDFHDVLALIAPRTCFVSSPLHDPNFSSDSAKRVVDAARVVYRWHQAEEQLSFEQPDAGHAFPPASVAKAIAIIEAK